MIGQKIGNYRIETLLGEGGMGQVFRAVDTMLEREVAIKALHSFLTQDESRLQRFRSEAVTLAKLNHPNIALLYNFFEHGGVYYMVMEYVEGETFESLITRLGTLPLRLALEWFCQALRGFEHAHARSVIHRDIKPGNLMLSNDGTVKITDFGIARVLGASKLTQTGRLIGTPEYMSPEQVQGGEQDTRSDIYSLGILLYEMLTGRVPFTSTSDFEIMRGHLEGRPKPPRELGIELPDEVERAMQRALDKDPAARFQNAADFRAALEATLANLPAAPPIAPQIKHTRLASTMPAAAPETMRGAEQDVSTNSLPLMPPTVVVDAPRLAPAAASATARAPMGKRLSPRAMMAGGAALGLSAVVALGAMLLRPAGGPAPRAGNSVTVEQNTARDNSVQTAPAATPTPAATLENTPNPTNTKSGQSTAAPPPAKVIEPKPTPTPLMARRSEHPAPEPATTPPRTAAPRVTRDNDDTPRVTVRRTKPRRVFRAATPERPRRTRTRTASEPTRRRAAARLAKRPVRRASSRPARSSGGGGTSNPFDAP